MAIRASNDRWDRFPVSRIEDLKQAVLGAGLDAAQFSKGSLHGSLAFATCDDITYSTGYLGGQVALSGALSEDRVTLGLGIDLQPGSRQWLGEVSTGEIAVFLPGDSHSGFYTPGSIYACATLSFEKLEEIGADLGLVLDARQLGGSGILPHGLKEDVLAPIRRKFARVHRLTGPSPGPDAGIDMVEGVIAAIGRAPRPMPGSARLSGHGRIAARAQDYIVANLEHPLSIRSIARAAYASQSTLYRAFFDTLCETPQSFVRKLRLNRIRRDLASEAELRCTITVIANRWGIGELGRLAGWYRELFDELPSQTRARCLAALQGVAAEKVRRSETAHGMST